MLRKWWRVLRISDSVVVAICLTLSCDPQSASAQDGGLPGLLRKRFGAAEGSPIQTNRIAQTQDGFLWLIGGGMNLVRFDGRTFHQFETLEPVRALAAAPDGDLWVAETSRLVRIPSANLGRFTLSARDVHTFAEQGLRITSLEFSKQGALWIGTSLGLFRYAQNRMEAVGPRFWVRHINEAPDGRMLVTTTGELLEIVGSTVTPDPLLAGRLGVKRGEIIEAFEDSHGTRWYTTPLGIARDASGRLERIAPYGSNSAASNRVYEDAHGRMWISKGNELFRVSSTRLELVASDTQVTDFFNDRDGNLWVSTWGDGLYRYKEAAVRMFTTADGLPGNTIMKVIESRDGTIWVGANCGGIARFDGRRFHTLSRKEGLSADCVFGLAEDGNHDLWVGTSLGGAFRYRNGAFQRFSRSDGLADDFVTHILHARDGSLWISTNNVGLSRLKDGRFRTFTVADGLPTNSITRTIQDEDGVIWVGTPLGIARLVNERFETVSFTPRTAAFPVGGDRDGGFYVTYRGGRGYVTCRIDRAGKVTSIGLEIASMIQTQSGELWIGGPTFARVWPGQLSTPRPRDEPVDQETFSADDGFGADVGSSSMYNMIQARDGTIWAATPQGVAMFDPRRLAVTRARPLVYLAAVTIGRSTVHPEEHIVLPPGTGHVEIDFAAVDVSAPEKIRMQYRLDGVDAEWLDAGPVRKAVYSTLPPGTHVLRIRACNRSGIWDRDGVAFTVTQQPFFYQTGWFVAAIVVSTLLAIAAVYRRRVHQISLAMSIRFDERLAERTRVARELHDTLLQTVQGSKLAVDDALDHFDNLAETRRTMEQLSLWLGQATREGRATVNALRETTTEQNDLADALRRAINDCRRRDSPEATLSVTGEPRETDPVVRDEVYRMGYEAIRNACIHSGGSRLEVELHYAQALTMRVADNGVGMDPAVADRGKDGHFGLQGMRERAARIGATLRVASSADTGTEIVVTVPGRVIFRQQSRSFFHKLLARVEQKTSTKI